MVKKAFITGITGQDGPYLAKLLLSHGYEVHAGHRRTSVNVFENLRKLGIPGVVTLHDFDLTDEENMRRVFVNVMPDEVYNLAAQSHVHVSFKQPRATTEINYLGVLKFLEIIKNHKIDTRFYQASTSEMFGKVQQVPQDETTPFYPRSPYGVAKLAAHWLCKNYRESYQMFICNGILFNHESPIRGTEFVTRKITKKISEWKKGHTDCIELGNIDSKRDWGFAGDYVEAMWLMLNYHTPDDYVVSTGKAHSVREFVEASFKSVGVKIIWDDSESEIYCGVNVKEKGIDANTGKTIVRINKQFVRPAEVDFLLGDSTKAKTLLGWSPKVSLEELVKMMMDEDMKN